MSAVLGEMRGVLAPGRRRAYALAGRATITIRSTRTGERFTYRVSRANDEPYAKINRGPVWFVGLLGGPDNVADYRYIGVVDERGFRLTAKSRVGPSAPSVVAFSWLARNWESGLVEVWHEGSCGRCGRRLTVPESIESGIGPTCAGRE